MLCVPGHCSLLTTRSELLGVFCPLSTEDPLGPHSQPLSQDPLSSLERQLALQLQITEAARRLCAEENISRQARRQRKHAALQEEKKLRDLQRCLGDQRRNSEPPPTTVPSLGRGEPAVLSRSDLTQLLWDIQRSPALSFWLVPSGYSFLGPHRSFLTYVPHKASPLRETFFILF